MTSLSTTVQERISLPTPARSPNGGDGSPITAADIIAMLRRRTVLIVLLFMFFSALTAGGFVAWWIHFPGYRAEALIECISDIPDAGRSVEQQRPRQDEYERFVLTQANLLKSTEILGKTLQVTAVRETGWYKAIDPGEHLLKLTGDLRSGPVRGTNLLRVAIETRNPKDGPLIVNEVVRQWLEHVKKHSADELTDEPLEAAQRELEQLNSDILASQNQLKSIQVQLAPGGILDPAGNVASQQVKEFATQVAQRGMELSLLDPLREIYNDPAGVAVTAEDRAFVEADPQVGAASQRLLLLEQQRDADAGVYGSGHAVTRQIEAQIRASADTLHELRTLRLVERRASMREQTNTAYDTTVHALLVAREQLQKAEAALHDQDSLRFDYATVEGLLEAQIEERLAVSEYVKNLSRIKTQRTAVRVNVQQGATDPLERSSPSVFLIPVGVFLSLALSFGIALGLEMLDTSVRTPQDIVRHVDVALLGFIPHTDDEEVDIRQVETAVRDTPNSMVAEAFHQIRTNLQFSAPAERQRAVLITSPRPDDGKTTVACNLALALSQGGRRVLLVDANFRRPAIHRIFGEAKPEGLSNLLVGDGSLDTVVAQTAAPLLDVLGSGPTPPNPVDLLGSEHCQAFLRDATSRYDQVIIDTSPILLASDAAVLGSLVDGVIVVVRAKKNSRGAAQRACRLLTGVGAHVFGAVLNAAQVARGGYFREQLRAYYDYQPAGDAKGASRPALPKQPPTAKA